MTKQLRFFVSALVFTFISNISNSALVQAGPKADRQKLSNALAGLPLSFEANRGQADDDVKFLSRTNSSTLFLTAAEAVVSLNAGKPAVFKIGFGGAHANPVLRGLAELPGKSNYFIGNKPEGWRTGIPTFAKVKYEGIYPGIDLIFYGNQRQVEFDFVVAPGADPKAVRLDFQGVDKMRIAKNGELVLQEGKKELRVLAPHIYQERGGAQQPVTGRFVCRGRKQAGFEIAAYDMQKPLVIDPVLSFSTYLGGTSFDQAQGIDVDDSGNVYVTGWTTSSTSFPRTAGAFDTSSNGSRDVFVTKFNPSGTSLIYSTYIGGSSSEEGLNIAADDSGNAYVTGRVSSTNFPVVNGFQDTLYPSTDAFVCKLNPSGSALSYSTYFGGAGAEYSISSAQIEGDIVLDDSGYVYIAGHCQGGAASPFPTTPGAFQTVHPGSHDAFVAKFNTNAADAASLIYCTFVGGFNTDANYGLAVDAAGNAYITGNTISSDWPTTPNAYRGTYPGTLVAYVTKLNSTGTALLYSTFFNTAGETGFDCEADSAGNVYVTGSTGGTGFPTTVGAYQTTYGGSGDAFLSIFNTNASGLASLVYSTYLGGGGLDQGTAVDLDSSGNVYLAGITASANFPTKDSVQGTPGGGNDVFMTKLNPAVLGSAALVFSTYLGGTASDTPYDQAIDACGNVYVAGTTTSTNFPTQNPYQAIYGGGGDAIVVKLGDAVCSACAAAKGDMDGNGSLAPADVVAMLNCVYLTIGSCDLCFADVNCSGDLTPSDVVIELNMVYLAEPPGC